MTRRAFLLSTTAYVMGTTVQTTFLFFLAPVALAAGGNGHLGAVVFGSSAMATVLTVVPAGRLADRYARRTVMAAGFAIAAAASLPIVVDPVGLVGLTGASVLMGAGYAMMVIAYNSYVADLISRERMVAAFGRAGSASVLVSALGPVVAAAVMTPVAPVAFGIRAVALLFFLGMAAALVIAMPLPSIKTDQTPPAFNPNPPQPSALGPLMVMKTILGIGLGLTAPYFALFFLEKLAVPDVWWGLLLSAGTVAGALGFWLSGRLVTRVAPRVIILTGQAGHVVVALAFSFDVLFAVLAAAYILRTVVNSMVFPLTNTILMTRSAPALRGQANGWTSLALNAGWGVGAIAGGFLLPVIGGHLFPVGAAVCLIGVFAGFSVLERRFLFRPVRRTARRAASSEQERAAGSG